MKIPGKKLFCMALAAGWLAGGLPANATTVNFEITNLTPAGGLYFSPLWVAFHDGNFDTFNNGEAASTSIEAIAERGDSTGLRADFAAGANMGAFDTVLTSPGGFPGAPIFDPGETVSAMFDLDAITSSFFSFAAMAVPSNDAFIANADAISLFDAEGNFVGVELTIFSNQIWDSGTEVNDGFGAAFTTLGGEDTDENGFVHFHEGISSVVGTLNANGELIEDYLGDFSAGFEVARISITAVNEVAEPAMLSLMGFAVLGMMGISRRRRQLA
ncbi:spondin domain-containing protein [Emcibacter sp.]|uniref:spondin domain-containing protein n=1 Tax=Emcibacter sp. TaxID=1979954 RepID=UPI002AA6F782|nr:spondin domain-containing protein [Emcibacter sp.]